MKKPKTAEWEKEFYSKFTHDWPPEFYRKEEMKDLPRKVVSFINSQKAEILDEVIKKVKILVKITPPEFQEAGRFTRKDWEDIGYNNSLSDVIKLLTDMRGK